MAKPPFRGVYAPLATPFDHSGEIYWAKLDHNLSALLRTGLSGVVVCDQWGEGPLLTVEERVKVWARVAERAAERASVIAAVLACGVAESRSMVAQAQTCGCTAAIIEAPSLGALAPASSTASLYFRSVADTAEIPILIRVRSTGAERRMSSLDLASVAAHPRIAGAILDDAPADQVRAYSAACGPRFPLLTGSLHQAVPALAGPACAALLTIAAIVPFFALSIEEAVRTREIDAANDLVERATPLARLLDRHGVPALKSALDLRGSYGGPPRLPLVRLDWAAKAQTERAVAGLAS